MAEIEIDPQSGFCFGVVTAINKAEEELAKGEPMYCLGDIVHNNAEVERLKAKGLTTIDHDEMRKLHGVKVLLRAHGEPPSTYADARANGIKMIDATCPVVLKLQQRIKAAYDASLASGEDVQIVIYGRIGHAEVNGLVGQTNGNALVIEGLDQLDKINFNRNIALYSQTTKSLEGFSEIISEIKRRVKPGVKFEYSDTICRQVANRVEHLRAFAAAHDVVLFVAGEKSSNGKILFAHCQEVNKNAHLVADPDKIEQSWLIGANSIGICGATSTPRWLMEDVATRANEISN
jgi:4-hydroxy-3-methylbut-2-enyl diphosphate reductase